jgi:integrase
VTLIPLKTAAEKAKTDFQYLYKLVKAGKVLGKAEAHGKQSRWYVDDTCPRYAKLLARLEVKETVIEVERFPYAVWLDMCRRGEYVTKRPCTERSVQTHDYYAHRYFARFNEITPDNLRLILSEYEARSDRDRDFYSVRNNLYHAVVSAAKYLVYTGAMAEAALNELYPLRPKRTVREQKRPCFTGNIVKHAAEKAEGAKTLRGNPAYTPYNAALNQALVIFALETAARAAEICAVRMTDIDMSERSIKLYGKGRKVRYVGISDTLLEALALWSKHRPRNTTYLFVGTTGNPLTPALLYRRMSRLGVWSGTALAPHAIRRSGITAMLVEKSLPLPIVRDAVGHSAMHVTDRYAKPSQQQVINAMVSMRNT